MADLMKLEGSLRVSLSPFAALSHQTARCASGGADTRRLAQRRPIASLQATKYFSTATSLNCFARVLM
jgi:hypothetical protein